MLTRKQFQDQFKTQLVYDDNLASVLVLDQVVFDTPVYRALEKLVIIKDDGNYYMR